MSEPVEIWRGESTTDADGNPMQGDPAKVSEWLADVAEAHYDEPAEPARGAVLIGGKAYIRDQGPTGALATDLIKIRGELLPIDGRPVDWYRRSDGSHIGVEIAFRRADG